MRLFVALDIPQDTRHALGAIIERLRGICRGARWLRAESIHVTLKFIGHVEEARLPAIQGALADARSNSPIDIAFRHFGFFPNERHPHVFWAGIEAGPELAALAGSIESSLEPLGINREQRAFRPHLTLARFKTEDGLPKLRAMLASLPSQNFGTMTATQFDLYETALKPEGAVHTKLASYPFVKGANA